MQQGIESRGTGRPERRPRAAARALFLLLPFALLAAAEGGLRASGFRHPPLELPITIWNAGQDDRLFSGSALHVPDIAALWRPRPGAPIPWARTEFVSARGYRGSDPGPAALRVAALGDSSTFGWRVEAAEAWPAELARAIVETGVDVQVVNGGVIGYTARQGVERLGRLAEEWRPDVVVAAFGAVNEHFPANDLPDGEKIAELGRRASRLTALSRGLRAELRVLHAAARLHDELRGGREARISDELERIRRERSDAQHYLEHRDYRRRVSVSEFREALVALQSSTLARGGTLVLVDMPRRAGVEAELWPVACYDAALRSFAARADVALAEGKRAFEEARARGRSEDELFLDSFHPTPLGHDLLAQAVLDALEPLLEAP